MAAQLEGIISKKIKPSIIVNKVEKLMGKGLRYHAEYDQVQYPKRNSIPEFNTFNGNSNPRQYLAQFKATCGNIGSNNALLF